MSDSLLPQEYRARINRVEDYIHGHLDQELSLEQLAETAAFSKYHFSRIFSMMSGYQPAEQPAFEEYPAETGSATAGAPPKHPVLLWLPLEPL